MCCMENFKRRGFIIYVIAKFVLQVYLTVSDRLFFVFFSLSFFYHSFFPSSCRSNCLSAIQPNRNSLVDFQTRHRAKDFRFIMEIFNYLIIIHRRPSRNTQIIPRNYSRESIKISLLSSPFPSTSFLSFHRCGITGERCSIIPSRGMIFAIT